MSVPTLFDDFDKEVTLKLNEFDSDITSHVENLEIHITEQERNKWNTVVSNHISKNEFETFTENLATKEELNSLATKNEIQSLLSRDDFTVYTNE